MAILAMALLHQHDARRNILIEPAARRRAAIEAWGIPNWGHSELGAQSGRKNQPACFNCCHFYSTVLFLLKCFYIYYMSRTVYLYTFKNNVRICYWFYHSSK